jgi:hypothetical protein
MTTDTLPEVHQAQEFKDDIKIRRNATIAEECFSGSYNCFLATVYG